MTMRFVYAYVVFYVTSAYLIPITQLTFHEGSHGFMNENPRYFEDELSHIHKELSAIRQTIKMEAPSQLNLKFVPEILNFREKPLGVPHSEIVTILNMDNNKTIDLTSISGNTVHFHSSFFEDKKIPPNGNTSFKVVFLGRQEGHVETNLFIHTSEGFVKYNVRAFGTYSDYRLRPIVGVKVPVNSTFSPVIFMHNPHSEPIQIVEVYSSGGGFHLQLPGREFEGPNELWQIQPQETKAIIRVFFEAKTVMNHSAYVRIKIHNPDEILVIPLEVEVTNYQGIFHPQGHIDFGMGGDMDDSKEIDLCLFNPLKKAVRVHSVSTPSKAIKTHYYNIRINPGNDRENTCVHVGTLTVDWKLAWKTQDYHGKIILKFRNGKNRTEIPYYLSVLRGGVSYDNMATTYFLNDKSVDLSLRTFEARNEFQYPLKISDVAFPFDADSIFDIETFTPKVIPPYAKVALFNIRLKNDVKKTDMQLTSYIKLLTNVSEITVPLISYNGKLQVHLPFKSEDFSLDCGLMGFDSKKEVYFVLNNPNPVSLHINRVYSSIPMTKVELYGCGFGDPDLALLQKNYRNLTKCHDVGANKYAIIKLTIHTTQIEGQVWGDIQIESPFENLSVPVHFKIAPGRLEIDSEKLVFHNCFPGKICTLPLKIYSTFAEKMQVDDIVALPPDKRITASISTLIVPKFSRSIGEMYYKGDFDCLPECYTGMYADTSAPWLKTMSLSKYVSEMDLQMVNTFYNRYENFTQNGLKRWHNMTLRLDTTEVRGHLFKVRVKYGWPTLIEPNTLNKSVMEYPLTQVGNKTQQTIIVRNPASHSIIVQLVFQKDYPNWEMVEEGVSSDFWPPEDRSFSRNSGFSFDEKARIYQQQFFEEHLNLEVHPHSLALLLLPGQSHKVHIDFFAEDSKSYSSLLFLRNNLTILEIVRLKAQGVIPHFKFGNRKIGSEQPLLFEITDRHLSHCERRKDVKESFVYVPNLTVKRTFTARNLGEIAIEINSFHINKHECEGYGFKVIDCYPFTLAPNGTKKVDIAFTPDLTLTKVSRTLILGTSLNAYVNYSLYTTISPTYLRKCAELLPRPPWEGYLSYITIVFMKILLFVIIFLALIDAENIKKQALEARKMANTMPTVQPVLDLRKVGSQIREEIQLTKIKKKIIDVVETRKSYEHCDSVKQKTRIEPALIPATGKSKRKLSQRNSTNDSVEENVEEEISTSEKQEREKHCRTRKKDLLFETHRLKSKERKTEKEQKLLEEKGKKDKHIHNKEPEVRKGAGVNKSCQPKSIKVSHQLQLQEEESSSTTTESSNEQIFEDVEKESQGHEKSRSIQKVTILTPTKVVKPLKRQAFIPSSAENSSIKQTYFLGTKPKTNREKANAEKSGSKSKNSEKFDIFDTMDDKSYLGAQNRHQTAKKRDKAKDRKDKSLFRNKNYSERSPKISESDISSSTVKDQSKSPTFFIPLPTLTAIPSIWGESRAKFSDVVARSDPPPCTTSTNDNVGKPLCSTGTKSSSSQVKTVTGKPTMYVEPFKPVELGPIGSKRLDTSDDRSHDFFTDEPMSNSFDSPSLRPLESESFSLSRTTNPNPMNLGEFGQLNDRSIIAAISGNSVISGDNLLTTHYNPTNRLLSHQTSNPLLSSWNLNQTGPTSGQSSSANHFPTSQQLSNQLLASQLLSNMSNLDADTWNRQQLLKSLLESRESQQERTVETTSANTRMEDPWNEDLLNSSSYWNNTFPETTAVSSESTPNTTSYLWGSHPVWKPWSPSERSSAPGTPKRPPPGLGIVPSQPKIEDQPEKRDSYSPFQGGGIFPQTEKSPWTYDGSHK